MVYRPLGINSFIVSLGLFTISFLNMSNDNFQEKPKNDLNKNSQIIRHDNDEMKLDWKPVH